MPNPNPADVATIEAQIGPRGASKCDSNNRNLFRRWIAAKGWGSDFAAILSVRELNIAYNSPAKGGGEQGKDAWLDKRLREFRDRQNEVRGGELPYGAELPVDPQIQKELDAERQRDRDAQDDDEPNLDAQLDDILNVNPKPQNNLLPDDRLEELRGEAKQDKAKEQSDLATLFRQFHDERLLQALAREKAHGPDKADELAKTLSEGMGKGHANDLLDGAAIKEIVDRRVAEMIDKAQGYAPREIVVKNADGELMGRVKGRTPPWFERVLRLLQQGQNVMLVGPPGCGKSHNARLLADAMGVAFGMVSGSAGASESQLTGWLLPIGDGGKFEYVPSDFVTKYGMGNALWCFDELDAFDPNMMVVSNGATANGHFHVPHRYHDPEVRRGENMMIIATANTYGTGGGVMFAGRNAMDSTTLDRYVVITVDYDVALERDIAEQGGLAEYEANQLWGIRKLTRENSLRRCISTRAFQKAAAMKAVGDSWSTVIDTLLAGWTADERAKVGV